MARLAGPRSDHGTPGGGTGWGRRVLGLVAAAALVLGAAPSASARTDLPDFLPFDASADEYPEGVAVDKVGNVYVSMNDLGQVWQITPSAQRRVVADFGSPGALGLAVNAKGNVYVARGLMYRGVWRIDPDGDAPAQLVPGTDQIALPNALAFDEQGNLYITETFSQAEPVAYACPVTTPILDEFGQGGVWRVPRGGEAELWLRSELLTGLCVTPIPYPVGANGVSYREGAVYVANTEKATVVRIPIRRNGSAGIPEVLATVTGIDPNFGPPALDGTAIDVHGNIYVAVVNQSRVVRISRDGSVIGTVASLADGDPLDSATSIAFGTGKGERRSLFAVNAALLGVPAFPGPALVKLRMDTPGMPLP